MEMAGQTTETRAFQSLYEPAPLEITITLALGLTVLSPYYRSFVRGLALGGDERVLDYGSGSGILSRHIARRLQRDGGKLACVDVSRGWQAVIRRTLRRFDNVGYHLGLITQLDLPAAAYDCVVIHFVLHEVARGQRSAVMRALARRLKPGGRIVLREPQGEGVTPEEIRELAAAAGLEVTSLTRTSLLIGSTYDAVLSRGA